MVVPLPKPPDNNEPFKSPEDEEPPSPIDDYELYDPDIYPDI